MEAIIKIITVIKMTYKTNRKEKKETFTWTRNWLGKNARKNLILKITLSLHGKNWKAAT